MCLALLVAAIAASCSRPPATPSPAQQARVGSYTAALAACDGKLAADKAAAEADGGRADRVALLASYQDCAHAVDVQFGRADGGAR